MAIAAVVLLMPLPVAGSLSHVASSATTATKAGALGERGHATDLQPDSRGRFVAGPVRTVDVAKLPQVAASTPSSALTPASRVTAAALHPTSPQLIGEFAGANQSASGGYYPPDTQVAMSGTDVFELDNEFGKITSTNGRTVYH
ncbi:MAG TPA: hypothetical protein VJQ43_04195, partial [Thermoplasmata archaeon]|nr:hypothetical protein [Thermoplasmata archaeon]